MNNKLLCRSVCKYADETKHSMIERLTKIKFENELCFTGCFRALEKQ